MGPGHRYSPSLWPSWYFLRTAERELGRVFIVNCLAPWLLVSAHFRVCGWEARDHQFTEVVYGECAIGGKSDWRFERGMRIVLLVSTFQDLVLAFSKSSRHFCHQNSPQVHVLEHKLPSSRQKSCANPSHPSVTPTQRQRTRTYVRCKVQCRFYTRNRFVWSPFRAT